MMDFNNILPIALAIIGLCIVIVLILAERRQAEQAQLPTVQIQDGEGSEAGKFTLRFKWVREDVVSIKRKRMVHSTRLKAMAVLGLVAIPVMTVRVFGFPPIIREENAWGIGALVSLVAIFFGIPAVLYLIGIPLEFRLNPIWRCEFQFVFCDERLLISGVNIPSDVVELRWDSVRGVMQNERAYALQFSSRQQDFIIVPKRIFETQEQVRFFASALEKTRP